MRRFKLLLHARLATGPAVPFLDEERAQETYDHNQRCPGVGTGWNKDPEQHDQYGTDSDGPKKKRLFHISGSFERCDCANVCFGLAEHPA